MIACRQHSLACFAHIISFIAGSTIITCWPDRLLVSTLRHVWPRFLSPYGSRFLRIYHTQRATRFLCTSVQLLISQHSPATWTGAFRQRPTYHAICFCTIGQVLTEALKSRVAKNLIFTRPLPPRLPPSTGRAQSRRESKHTHPL